MNRYVTLLFIMMFCSASLFAQEKDTVDVNGIYTGGSEGDLNTAVETAVAGGTLSTTVFRLAPYDKYVVTGSLVVPVGETLDLYAAPAGNIQDSAPPQLLWTASAAVTKEFFIQVYGDLIMKNIWVRFATVEGIQTGTPIVFEGDDEGLVVNHGTFENCIFEWMPCPAVTASGSICVRSKHFNGAFKNCYFRNCVDRHYMYYGRAVSFPFDVPGYHTDSCSFENCTFANMGYVYMQERTNYSDNVSFNHCTFYNVNMYTFESGWWWKLNVNNCLFVNTYMLGFIPAGGIGGATVTITQADSIPFEVPFTDQDRHILFTHSAYYIDDWLIQWMRGGWELDYWDDPDQKWRPPSTITTLGNPYSKGLYTERVFDEIPYPRPMLDSTALVYFDSTDTGGAKLYPLINRTDLYDVYSAEDKAALNPGFDVVPLNQGPLEYFLKEKWSTNQDSMWAYDTNAGLNQIWPLPENFAYTNEMYKTAGMDGFPLGDLYHWWNPVIRDGATDYYTAWSAQADDERAYIANWLETGNPTSIRTVNNNLPSGYILEQNYPNPFNPTTRIKYSLPVTGHVSLKVYNTLGQFVATLQDGVQKVGEYEATFNAGELASGVYIYKLQAGDVSISKKLILMK